MNDRELSLEDQVLPPPEPRTVYRLGVLGAGLCLVALLIGLVGSSEVGWSSTLRLLLVAAGCLTAGSAISLNPRLPLAWLIAAVAFAASYFGIPSHWDSARLVAVVGACICLAGGALAALPRNFRFSILSAMAVWHFGGIFTATTWPDPTPWTTQQVGTRMYLPYLMFMYLRNAYHFYSPNPGPASLIVALVKYDAKDESGKPEAQWVILPSRREHMKDPLGLTYYRRLSITEQVAQAMPPLGFSFEVSDVQRRRQVAAGLLGGLQDYPIIPIAPNEFEPQGSQYLPPRPDISRYLLPSYANHILTTHSTNNKKAVAVKIYRFEHRVVPALYFQKMTDNKPNLPPFHPVTYRPYYLGEFAANAVTGKVELIDSQDPLLYWLVPVLPALPSPTDPQKKDWKDYVSQHAGYTLDWRLLQP